MLYHEYWQEFYKSDFVPIFIQNYTKKSEYTFSANQNIYFVDSVVQGLTNRVIYFNAGNSNLLLESCKFDNISTSNFHGGVVFY